MASVDERVVRMEFDNSSFEKKIDQTLTSLGQLDKALKMEGASKGLADVSAAADKFHLGGMTDAIQGVSNKFLALSTIGITALATLTSKAVSAGVNIVKSLSLDQVMAGFKEYELNMNSIQTVLANTKSKGTNLKDVNKALDELNTYADKTIYDFAQMTHNIGTFTAAGVDLKTSVASIKGISNLAAISGSSADQASSAMYQLSQAVASGTLKLQDWNSVVNAGMGGEVFQKALFETGKAMKTIKNVPIGETFQQWTKAGNTFRGSLQDGWVTSQVLTNTLKGFTGEMTDAQLAAIGYSKTQIKQIQELGKTGVEAATKVRTLTQLIDTTKEAIGSGWSNSFRIVFGNFEEATVLFTNISDAISKMINNSAKARNELLQGWKDLGGRTLLISSITKVVKDVIEIIKPIKQAFADIFPPMTAKSLMNLTKEFAHFADILKPSKKTIDEIRRIFEGLFSILKIGWNVLKEGAKFVLGLVNAFTGFGQGGILAFLAKIGDFFTNLQKGVASGKNIHDFFLGLTIELEKLPGLVQDVKDKILSFFKGPAKDAITPGIDRVDKRIEGLKKGVSKLPELWKPFENAMQHVFDILDKTYQAIANWFKELGKKIAAVIGPGDFKATLDALNTALLGGIAALIARFLKGGINVDIGKGLFGKISDSFEQLTGVLQAMQTKIKAEALMKIAIAIGILTASVVALSLIDSAALTKSLTAMAVGFGELMGAFAIITKISAGPKGAASFDLIAGGMIALSTAVLILSGAVKILAGMKWSELEHGLGAVVALMAIMVGVATLISGKGASLIAAGIGMVAIADAITILAVAVKIFATMSWTEMGKGFLSVAAGLLIIAAATKLMPPTMPLIGLGLLLVAASLNILAGAMKLFATMSWTEMGKGLVGVAGGLLAIGIAMKLMPPTMPLIGVGLLLVSISLIAIAKAMQMMGGMSWGEIGKGIATMAAALVLLAAACIVMQDSIAGSVAIGIAAASLLLLSKVLKAFAGISWGDLLHGLVGIAAMLALIAGAALLLEPAIPAMLALGVALTVIGAGFALFGIGAMLVGKAFQLLAKYAAIGSKAMGQALENIGRALPKFITGFAKGILDLANVFLQFAPVLVKVLVVIISYLLDGLTKLIPQVLKIVEELLLGVIHLIGVYIPALVNTGIKILLAILKGISDNIGKVVELVGSIITNFLDAFATEIPKITQSVANLIITFFTNVAAAVGKVAGTLMFGIGVAFMTGFVNGLVGSESGPSKWFAALAGKVLGWIGNVINTLKQKGIDFITGLYNGISTAVGKVATWFGQLAGNVFKWVGNVINTIKQKGIDLISGLYNGIVSRIGIVASYIGGIARSAASWIGNTLTALTNAGGNLVAGLFNGITTAWTGVANWIKGIPNYAKYIIGDLGSVLIGIGESLMDGLLNGIVKSWQKVAGFLGGLASKIKSLKGPPDKDKILLIENGSLIMQGLQKGIEDEWDNIAKWLSQVDPAAELDNNIGDRMAGVLNNAITDMVNQIENMPEVSPTITPVLDLTNVVAGAKQIAKYMAVPKISPTLSYQQAQTIAATTTATQADSTAKSDTPPGTVKFEQNIYAPTQLSTSDIYKNTRNQITMAKQELSIP
jgi:tape measure domain-containing protein